MGIKLFTVYGEGVKSRGMVLKSGEQLSVRVNHPDLQWMNHVSITDIDTIAKRKGLWIKHDKKRPVVACAECSYYDFCPHASTIPAEKKTRCKTCRNYEPLHKNT